MRHKPLHQVPKKAKSEKRSPSRAPPPDASWKGVRAGEVKSCFYDREIET